MAGPYTKRQDSDAISDGWTISDGDDNVIAHLDTETMANVMMAGLLGDIANFGNGKATPEDYPEDEPLGEGPEDDE